MNKDKNTYMITVEIMHGESTYFDKQMISLSDEDPTDKLIIKEMYGDIPYDECTESWDIGGGLGYPLASIYSYQIVDPQHIEILNAYGIY